MSIADRVASRFKEAQKRQWKPLSGGAGWKNATPETLSYLLWDETETETIRDPNVPDEYEVADPEMLADAIPEMMQEHARLTKEWEKWQRQGWWPRTVKVKKLKLAIVDRQRGSKGYEFFFKKGETFSRKVQDFADKAIDSVVAGKPLRQLKRI